ncbi:hemerythrin domain-containing protein [Nocardia sp. NPDC003963]
MTEGEISRLVAWSEEIRKVHERLRNALRAALDAGDRAETSRDLLSFCHGFCAALIGHHEGEDRELFPAIVAAHPELRETLRYLAQDHSMIAHLITELDAALRASATPADSARHLAGIEAIMENHFRYEERQLLSVLETLELDADPLRVLGSP